MTINTGTLSTTGTLAAPLAVYTNSDPTTGTTQTALLARLDGTNHIGKVGESIVPVPFTLSLNTGGAYATGHLLADTQAVDAAFRIANGTGTIVAISVLDENDQGQAFTFQFHNANLSMGTERVAVSIDATKGRTILSKARVLTSDYDDLGSVRHAYIECSCPVKAISGTDDLAVSAILNSGTPTYTASGITGFFHIKQD